MKRLMAGALLLIGTTLWGQELSSDLRYTMYFIVSPTRVAEDWQQRMDKAEEEGKYVAGDLMTRHEIEVCWMARKMFPRVMARGVAGMVWMHGVRDPLPKYMVWWYCNEDGEELVYLGRLQ